MQIAVPESWRSYVKTGLLLIPLLALPAPAVGAGKTITLGGTGSSLGTMQKMAEAFMGEHPDISVTVLPSLGSGGGIKALIKGGVDISMSGRPLKEREQAQGLQARAYALCPFVVAVKRENPVSEITLDQLAAIYEGSMNTWEDGSAIRLVMRPERESDTEFLRSLSPEMDRAVRAAYARKGLLFAITDQETADKLEHMPGSIGPSTLCQITSEGRSLIGLSLNGVRPSPENIRSGTYPHMRTLYLVTTMNPPDHVQTFVDFVFSGEGARVLRENDNAIIAEQ